MVPIDLDEKYLSKRIEDARQLLRKRQSLLHAPAAAHTRWWTFGPRKKLERVLQNRPLSEHMMTTQPLHRDHDKTVADRRAIHIVHGCRQLLALLGEFERSLETVCRQSRSLMTHYLQLITAAFRRVNGELVKNLKTTDAHYRQSQQNALSLHKTALTSFEHRNRVRMESVFAWTHQMHEYEKSVLDTLLFYQDHDKDVEYEYMSMGDTFDFDGLVTGDR